MVKKFIVRDARMSNSPTPIKAGDTVYSIKFHDYGLASDDTRNTGIEHASVTLNPDGDYPFFTIPRAALTEVKE